MDFSNPLMWGSVLSFVLAMVKRIPGLGGVVDRNPKVIAALSAGVGAVSQAYLAAGHAPVTAAEWTTVASAGVQAFVAAVATHEVISDPIYKAVNGGNAAPTP